MNPRMIRQTWEVVSAIPPKNLLGLDDTDLVGVLLHEMSLRLSLSCDDYDYLRIYLSHRTPLIREITAIAY